MNKDTVAREVVDHMMDHDAFSQWLGIEVLEITEGQPNQLTIRKEMVNGFA
jgi:acyl-CoA thioesterase